VTFRFANEVRATMYTGLCHADLGCMIRVTGTEGALEILADAPWLRLRHYGKGVTDLDPGESIHDSASNVRAIQDLIDCIGTDKKPQLCSENALRTTEIIFAAYESSRRRGRVDLPLAPGPSALVSMVESDQTGAEA
jgi:UDP-N-acetylglucosamine 3-dehydrogenase